MGTRAAYKGKRETLWEHEPHIKKKKRNAVGHESHIKRTRNAVGTRAAYKDGFKGWFHSRPQMGPPFDQHQVILGANQTERGKHKRKAVSISVRRYAQSQ